MKYRVLRRLDGDRLYQIGDVREMAAIDAGPLVKSGALEEMGDDKPAKKAEQPLENKAEADPAPSNKARGKR